MFWRSNRFRFPRYPRAPCKPKARAVVYSGRRPVDTQREPLDGEGMPQVVGPNSHPTWRELEAIMMAGESHTLSADLAPPSALSWIKPVIAHSSRCANIRRGSLFQDNAAARSGL